MHLTTSWRVKSGDPLLEERMRRELHCSPLIARLLVNRGVLTPAEAQLFLAGSLDDLYNPQRMKSIEEAVVLIRQALDHGQKVLVYGDYDVDGMTATALLVKILKHLGARVGYQVPERTVGYGLHPEAVRTAAEDGYRLLITVDTGISAVAEIELARELGMEVVVTDHHEPNGGVPAVPAVNPKQVDCSYPFKHLAGVGVAYKLGLALCPDLPADLADELLGLVCLGTVADVVPLCGENRILVSEGLNRIPCNPGLSALLTASGINRDPTIRDLAFVLSPRLNAAGRVGHARRGVDLLLADAEEAPVIAAELSALNTHRQHLEAEITAQAMAEIAAWSEMPRFPVFWGENWHPGILGVLASRFAGRLQRPVAFLSVEGDTARGSARGVPEINLFQVFQEHASLFSDFGGHRQAVGFTLSAQAVPEFTETFNEHVAQILESASRVVEIDAEVSIRDLTLQAVEQIQRMEPWGCGNPEPVLLARNVTLRECREVGKNGAHLKLAVDDGSGTIRGIAFRAAEQKERMTTCKRLDLAFTPIINEWNGRRSAEIRLVDWRASGSEIEHESPHEHPSDVRSRAIQIYKSEEILPQALEAAFAVKQPDGRAGVARPLARWIIDYRSRRRRVEMLRPFVEAGQQVLVVVGNPHEVVDEWAYLEHRLREAPGEISFLHRRLDAERKEECRHRYAAGKTRILIGTPEDLAGYHCDTVFVWSLPHTSWDWEGLRALGSRLVLAYRPDDLRRNWGFLKSLAPNRKTIGFIFQLARRAGGPVSVGELYRCLAKTGHAGIRPWTVRTGCTVLFELGLAEEAGTEMVRLVPATGKSFLVNSPTFKHVHRIKKELYQLQRFFTTAAADDLALRLGCDIIAPGGR